jgi:hypothetical protein
MDRVFAPVSHVVLVLKMLHEMQAVLHPLVPPAKQLESVAVQMYALRPYLVAPGAVASAIYKFCAVQATGMIPTANTACLNRQHPWLKTCSTQWQHPERIAKWLWL